GADPRLAYATGRPPAADDEVAIGATTAADHHVSVGDRVDLEGDGFPKRQATVTGVVVLPALGPFQSQRATPGEGMVVPPAMFDADRLAGLVTFVGVDLAPGVDRASAIAALRGQQAAWGADSFTIELTEPLRPAEIIDADRMSSVPILVAALLGIA